MAKVNICNVVVKDNPCQFNHSFQFEITFECIEDLNDDLEWKIIYVGSAESEEYDQTLDTVVVGPIIAGKHMFVFEADPPNPNKIPREDVLGVTVVLLTCSYRKQEFIRVGYYVNNEYIDPELKENPPLDADFNKLQRNILATCPRVTRFKIDWGDTMEDSENIAPQPSTSAASNDIDGNHAMCVEGNNALCLENNASNQYSLRDSMVGGLACGGGLAISAGGGLAFGDSSSHGDSNCMITN